MADTIQAKILRYDPSVDEAPHYETYEVEFQDDGTGIMSALQVLHAINFDQEQIAYDHNCRSGLCGRCSLMVDGKPCLSCMTALEPGEHTFEPLAGYPVIRDLIVDKSSTYQKIVDQDVTVHTVEPIHEFKDMPYELWWNVLEPLNMCRECMCCYAVCPQMKDGKVWNEYAGPAAMAAIAQRHLDTVDESDRLRQAVDAGLFKCIQCGQCQAVCAGSAQIPITELIGQMQAEAEERGLKDESGLRRF